MSTTQRPASPPPYRLTATDFKAEIGELVFQKEATRTRDKFAHKTAKYLAGTPEAKRYARDAADALRDAETLLLSGYVGLAGTIPDADRIRLIEAANRLVDLYGVTGDAVQAAKWRAERTTIREVLPRPRDVQ